MKTFMLVWFSSEGAKPSQVNERLLALGFKPIEGNYDYVYNWGAEADIDDILQFGDKIQAVLKGTPPPWLRKALAKDGARTFDFEDDEATQ